MENQWGLIREVKSANDNHIEALAEVPFDSPWFSGHFPGEPILPGIALVHLVKQAISQEAKTKKEQLQFHSLRRVRFTQPVRPGDKLSVDVSFEDAGEDILFFFKVLCKENVVSSGIIAAKRLK